MQEPVTDQRRPTGAPSGRHRGKWAAGVVALVVAASLALPVAVVFLGILLVALVALDSGIKGVVPGLRSLFRVPVAPASKRRARLMLAGGVGVLLIACGATGAKFGGQMKTKWKLRQSQRLAAEEQVNEHLERARKHIAKGELELAELTLMDVDRITTIDPERRLEIDELLQRVRHATDRDEILAILLRLPPGEFEAFTRGDSVPEALEFPERALTYRAVELARAQVEQAKTARAHR